MKYVLVKYKTLKLLINEGLPMQPLIDHLNDIVELEKKVKDFYANLLNETRESGLALKKEQQALISTIGYTIIGMPFDNKDPELYALDKRLEYEVLELHGNVGNNNSAKEIKKDSHIQMRVSREQKAGWVKQAQREGLKLTEWITKKLNGEL